MKIQFSLFTQEKVLILLMENTRRVLKTKQPCSTNDTDISSGIGCQDLQSIMDLNRINPLNIHQKPDLTSIRSPRERKILEDSIPASLKLQKQTKSSKQIHTLDGNFRQLKNRVSQKKQVRKLVRIADLAGIFREKTTLNSETRAPVSYDPLQTTKHSNKQNIFQHYRPQIPEWLDSIILSIKMVIIAFWCFIWPLSLLYPALGKDRIILSVKTFAILLVMFDLLETLSGSRILEGQSICERERRARQKRTKRITIQVIGVICTIISVFLSFFQFIDQGNFIMVGFFIGFKHWTEQLLRLQQRYLNTAYSIKCWSLCKVVIINLFACHLIACLLIAVAINGESTNWMTISGTDSLQWHQQYIWSYYFSTTIILTIGFGDLHATNSTEALTIIVVSFLACAFFGYNISYIGNLVSSIKQQEYEKQNRLRILSSLAKKSKVSKSVVEEITNYIVEEAKIKQEFNYTEQKSLLRDLPQSLRSSFLQQANEQLFSRFCRFLPLTNTTIQKLTLKIQTRFCHPDQMIKISGSQPSLLILQSGQVGLACRSKHPSRLRGMVIQRINTSRQHEPKLVCVDLLSNDTQIYDIKSLDYSIISEIGKTDFQNTIVSSKKDYELYKQRLDKCKMKLNEFGIVNCRFCQKMHTLFQCPKVHFLPFRQVLPSRVVKNNPSNKQARTSFERANKDNGYIILTRSKNLQLQNSQKSQQNITEVNSGKDNEIKATRFGKRKASWVFRHSNENMRATIQIMSQLRADIRSLKRNSYAGFEFNLWDNVDCDQVYNFSHYFVKSNAQQFSSKQIKNTLMNWTCRMKKTLYKSASIQQ